MESHRRLKTARKNSSRLPSSTPPCTSQHQVTTHWNISDQKSKFSCSYTFIVHAHSPAAHAAHSFDSKLTVESAVNAGARNISRQYLSRHSLHYRTTSCSVDISVFSSVDSHSAQSRNLFWVANKAWCVMNDGFPSLWYKSTLKCLGGSTCNRIILDECQTNWLRGFFYKRWCLCKGWIPNTNLSCKKQN